MYIFTMQPRRDAPRFRGAMVCIVLLSLLVLSACNGGRGGSIPYNVEGFGQPDAAIATTLKADYRIAPLDKLSINVFQVPELSGTYQVDLTGQVAMPLIGNVSAVNLTPSELQILLTRQLSEQYLNYPDVTVGITEAGGSQITVDGSVKRPGVFPVFGSLTLLQAIATAGGEDETANPKRVAIFRQIDGKRSAAAFDLTSIRNGEDNDPQIYRGDIIVVDGSTTRRAFRDIISTLPLASLFVPVI